MKRAISAAVVLALFGVTAYAAEFALNGDNVTITFVGSKPEGKHDGGFKKLKGTASVTGADATTLKLNVTIETDSIFSDDQKLTGHLKSPDFFNVKANPTSKFEVTKVEKTAAGHTIHGKFTLNGKTKEIHFPAKVEASDKGLTLTSSFKINRTDYGMTYGKGKINDDVDISVKVDAK